MDVNPKLDSIRSTKTTFEGSFITTKRTAVSPSLLHQQQTGQQSSGSCRYMISPANTICNLQFDSCRSLSEKSLVNSDGGPGEARHYQGLELRRSQNQISYPK